MNVMFLFGRSVRCCFFLLAFSSIGASVFAQTNAVPSTPPATLNAVQSHLLAALGERYVDASFALNPIRATMVGETRYAGQFVNDLTPEARERDRALQTETLAALKKIDSASLSSTADQLTYAVLEYRLKARLEELQFDFNLTPFNQFYSLPLTLVQLASTQGAQPFRTVADYDAFLRRMDGFPGWVDSAITVMREGMKKQVVQPKILMVRVLDQLKTQMVADASASGFYAPVMNFPATFGADESRRLTDAYRNQIAQKTTPAFDRLYKFIEKEYLPQCRDTAGLAGTPNGAAKYAFRARESTTTQLTPDEIHQIGLSEVARIRGEMEKVRETVRQQQNFDGDLNTLLASVPTNPKLTPFKSEAEVIEAYRVIQRHVTPLLEKLFLKQPRSALDIRPEPEITRLTAAAHYNVGAPDGSRPGIFYAPVRDATTYSTPKMTSLFLHEALPGHHFESSLAQESGLSRLRRYSRFTAYGEGWGLYAESLGVEMGVYGDPYQYLGRLLGEMHRAIRLVVDTGLHAKGWSREQAIDYSLASEGGRREDQVQEIERYMAIPGQALAYKIGELKIMELRRAAEQKLGARFDLRAFHNELLKDGNLPLAVLETKMNRWVEIVAAGATTKVAAGAGAAVETTAETTFASTAQSSALGIFYLKTPTQTRVSGISLN